MIPYGHMTRARCRSFGSPRIVKKRARVHARHFVDLEMRVECSSCGAEFGAGHDCSCCIHCDSPARYCYCGDDGYDIYDDVHEVLDAKLGMLFKYSSKQEAA